MGFADGLKGWMEREESRSSLSGLVVLCTEKGETRREIGMG